MAKSSFISHTIYDYRGADVEVNDGKSKTLPDQAMTIAQLFERSRAGMPLEFLQGVYIPDVTLDDIDVSKLSGMDIVDQKIALRSFTDRVARYQSQLDELYVKEQEASKARLNASSGSDVNETGGVVPPVPGK